MVAKGETKKFSTVERAAVYEARTTSGCILSDLGRSGVGGSIKLCPTKFPPHEITWKPTQKFAR
ncbi:hypothetical protein CGZ80_17170 [Rhodopirellula sp. MGV]|nr:hypothetical protein CGZ80_17170 [Rhodopirellula sp. MGV]